MLQRHIITPEYPPQSGGVSDYSRQLSLALAAEGEQPHVWCPGNRSLEIEQGVTIHRTLGRFRLNDLRRTGEEIDQFPGPRRILVQWTPHGYGWRSMNLPFCVWLLKRSLLGDFIEIMIHEPFLAFEKSRWRQNAAAVVHRAMIIALLAASRKIWISIPEWEPKLKRYTLLKRIPFQHLAIPSNVAVVENRVFTEDIRNRCARVSVLIGHFGTYGKLITNTLEPTIVRLCSVGKFTVLLIGAGGPAFLEGLLQRWPELTNKVLATGNLDERSLSAHLTACDIFVQPYPDGVSSRRGSAMAILAHGKPLVTTSGHLTANIWHQEDFVEIVEAGDVNGLVSAVIRLEGDALRRARLAAAGERLYRDRFAIGHTVAALRGNVKTPFQEGICGSS